MSSVIPVNLRSTAVLLVTVALIVLGHAEKLEAQNDSFSSDLEQKIKNSRAYDAYWAVVIRDSTGNLLEGYNHEKIVRPASNFKLLSTAAILDQLGPDFRFSTKMYGLGYQKGDTWHGDIYIRGSGDPSISGEFYGNDRFYVFEKFYSVLDSLGIGRIEGNIIGNDAYFDGEPYPEGWSWEDLSFYYGVEISALSFNNNAVDLSVNATGAVGETPGIEWFPFDTDYVTFVNEQVITPSGSEYDEFYRREPGTNRIILRSKVPRNYVEKESLAVFNATMFFVDTFKKYLEGGGITVTGSPLTDNRPQDWSGGLFTKLAEHRSVPLKRLLAQVNKESNNFYVEMLLKTAAAERYNTAGSTELGLSIIRDFAHSLNIDTTAIEMQDASGMAGATRLRADDLNRLLVRMQDEPHFGDYRNSLAVAGRDGLLSHRFRNSPLRGRLWGKTGYVSGVRALSGYMRTSSGRLLIFSILTNNYTEKTSYIDYIHESILSNLYYTY